MASSKIFYWLNVSRFNMPTVCLCQMKARYYHAGISAVCYFGKFVKRQVFGLETRSLISNCKKRRPDEGRLCVGLPSFVIEQS
jgi:hypothetical protein